LSKGDLWDGVGTNWLGI